jgi:hypothetical protein
MTWERQIRSADRRHLPSLERTARCQADFVVKQSALRISVEFHPNCPASANLMSRELVAHARFSGFARDSLRIGGAVGGRRRHSPHEAGARTPGSPARHAKFSSPPAGASRWQRSPSFLAWSGPWSWTYQVPHRVPGIGPGQVVTIIRFTWSKRHGLMRRFEAGVAVAVGTIERASEEDGRCGSSLFAFATVQGGDRHVDPPRGAPRIQVGFRQRESRSSIERTPRCRLSQPSSRVRCPGCTSSGSPLSTASAR